MFTVLVVENNEKQIDYLVSILEKSDLSFEILKAKNESDGFNLAITHDIDLFLIDIDLEDSNGVDLARRIRKLPQYSITWIVFLSVNQGQRHSAFEGVRYYDYVIKPYSEQQIFSILETLFNNKYVRLEKIKYQPSIFVEEDKVMYKIWLKDIIFVESLGTEIFVHTLNRIYQLKKSISSNSFKNMEKELSKEKAFIKCHRSYIINQDYVKAMHQLNRKTIEVSFIGTDKRASISYKHRNIMNKELR